MGKGQLVGYIRVSTEEQNTARQQEALAEFNLDKTFTDKASGKDTERPQLQAALAVVVTLPRELPTQYQRRVALADAGTPVRIGGRRTMAPCFCQSP